MKKPGNLIGLTLLLLSALSWGPAYLFIKLAVADIPPLTIALLRVVSASLIFYCICVFQKQSLSKWNHLWKKMAVIGFLLIATPFTLISWGERYIPSSVAGLLVSLALIVTVILAHFYGKQERLTRNKMLGICAGIIGLCFIYLPTISHETIQNQIGILLVVLASCSIGSGTVYARTHLQKVPVTVALTMQLMISALILLPLSLLIDRPFSLPAPSAVSLLSVLALTVISTVLAYYFYYKNIQLSGATYASFALIIIPIFALMCGAIFLHEQLTWNIYLGSVFILAGIGAVNPVFNRK